MSIILDDVYSRNAALLSLSALGAVWSAGAGFATLIRGLEEINEQKHPDGFFVRRIRGTVLMLAMVAALLLSILLMGFGRELIYLTQKCWPGVTNFFTFLLKFRMLSTVAILTIFFSSIFKWGTGQRPPLREVWPGAFLASVGWCLFSWVFSAWVSVPARLSTYGSLATVVVVMLWLYYCQFILLLGACFNRALPRMGQAYKR